MSWLPLLCVTVLAAVATSCAPLPAAEVATAPVAATAIPVGDGQQTVSLAGSPVAVFTYKPPSCTPAGILLVFHGVDRNVAGYCAAAQPLAQRNCLVLAAPLFDRARFPGWRYQRGGVVHRDVLEPRASWTVNAAAELVAWVRGQEGRPGLPYAEVGHSAGAQYLSRVAAYTPDEARAIVIANPSTWVRASLSAPAGYGFGPPFPSAEAEQALRRYLAAPITVLLGREDHGSKELADSDEAEDQGVDRFDRGQRTFAEAKAAAAAQGWPFNWRLEVVPGVGHNARGMLTSDAAFAALAGMR